MYRIGLKLLKYLCIVKVFSKRKAKYMETNMGASI